MFKLDPEVSVGFLINDVSRLMRAWFDARAQDFGLTRAQWRVLVHLAARQGINQRSLARLSSWTTSRWAATSTGWSGMDGLNGVPIQPTVARGACF